MTAAKTTAPDDLRMSGKEFGRIMGRALRVKPEKADKPERVAKVKAPRKKRSAKK
jgi:hypothetical protein